MDPPADREAQLIQEVRAELSDQVERFHDRPSLAGLQPDLLADLPSGERILFELKVTPTGERARTSHIVRRAREVLDQYVQATGSDAGLVVFDQLPHPIRGDYVTDIAHLSDAFGSLVDEIHERPSGEPRTRERAQIESREDRPSVFAAMPFDSKYDDTFFLGIRVAARQCGADAVRIDEEYFDDQIIAEIHNEIEEAEVVVADLSEGNPNVLYEVGYAEGIDQNRVQISSTPLGELPFNVQGWNTISYDLGGVYHLRPALEKHISQYIP